MSILFGQHQNGLALPEGRDATVPLADFLSGTTFVSAQGRIYRLFGNEDEPSFLPEIPPLPSVLTAPRSSALSLEEALQQIVSFDSEPAPENKELNKSEQKIWLAERICSQVESPPLQVFQVLDKKKISATKDFVSAEDIIKESFPMLSGGAEKLLVVPKGKKEPPLRILPESAEEPFIIPFVPLERLPEEPKTETITLKVVAEPVPPIPLPSIIRTYRHRRANTLYRKRCALPISGGSEKTADGGKQATAENLPPKESVTFHWSEQLDALMRTAENQIQMLADHLLVQWNQGKKTICFKSVFPGDGCSTLLLCAARALLERNYRILLVDAHCRHIDLPTQLNLPEHVLQENDQAKDDLLTLNDSLDFWFWRKLRTSEENWAALAKIIASHQEKYDFILLDDGSVTESPLTTLIQFWNLIHWDGILLVSNTKRPSDVLVSHIAGRLRQHHLHVLGIAENYV